MQKIRPMIEQKLTELLGSPEEEFAEFILESLDDHMSAEQLSSEVETVRNLFTCTRVVLTNAICHQALGVDPEKFVVPLWHVLVCETERVAGTFAS